MNKLLLAILALGVMAIFSATVVQAQVSHLASEIIPGDFGIAGDSWSFPGSVSIGEGLDVNAVSTLNGITLDNDADITGADRIVGYNDLRLYGDVNGGPDITISTAGNVGIGTAPTTARLRVSGDISINGDITATGSIWNASACIGQGGGLEGPTSSTDNELVRFDGTGGDLLKGSPITVTDAARMDWTATDSDTGSVQYTTSDRWEWSNGGFYIMSSSPTTWLYSTNTYIGAASGDTIHTRGNVVNLGSTAEPTNLNVHTDTDESMKIYYTDGSTRTQVGDIGAQDTTWLRINQDTAKNIYTQRLFRADGGLIVRENSVDYGITGTGALNANTGSNVAGTLGVSGTLTLSGSSGNLITSSDSGVQTIALSNDNINGVNTININDAGADEGVLWSGTGAKIFVSPLGGGNTDGYLRLINDGGIVFEPGAENTEAMTLTSGGNVGIGTSSPSSGLKLDVEGKVGATEYCDETGGSCFNAADVGNGGGSLWTPSGSNIYYNTGGNVGIGTTTIPEKLTVNGNVQATAFLYSSDYSLKKDITTLDNSLEKILKLRGVSFNWKEDGQPSIGLVAQEVENVFPELVTGEDGSKTVQYGNLVASLIEAVKEQQKEIEELESRIEELEG